MLYMIAFDHKFNNRGNVVDSYLGYAADVRARHSYHERGQGARLTQVAALYGAIHNVAVIPGNKPDERHYKNWRSHKKVMWAWFVKFGIQRKPFATGVAAWYMLETFGQRYINAARSMGYTKAQIAGKF